MSTVRHTVATLAGFALAFGCLPPALAAHTQPSTTHRSGGGPAWNLLPSAGTATFRSLAPVSRKVAWIGSDDGTVLRTTNGGQSWADVSPPGTGGLHFRDIAATDTNHAVVMTAGPGTDSRFYITADAGRSWRLAFQNTDPNAFFDCMSFSDARRGLAVSDPPDGKFRIYATYDGGRSWTVLPNAGMPAALPGEYGFADSGECMATIGNDAWFGGGGSAARVFHSRDGGLTWTVSTTPITVSGDSAGIFALAFHTPLLGIVMGGDFNEPDRTANLTAASDFGREWITPPDQPSGFRMGITYAPSTLATFVAVGANGSDVSYDGGLHWTTFDTGEFNTTSCARDGSCWAAGDTGRVALLRR